MSANALRNRSPWQKDMVGAITVLPRVSTKDLLIEAGERLFGQHGFDGISLREIAGVAGQRNPNAVQYHFKDKRGFISAILYDRVTRVDALRRERFDALRSNAEDNLNPRDLLKIIWLPDMTVTGPDGSHTYCRFTLQYLLKPDVGVHPYYKVDAPSHRMSASREGNRSCLFGLNKLLQQHYPDLSRRTFNKRISALSMMFLSCVVEHDNARIPGRSRAHPMLDVEAILDMSVGALSAPEQNRR